MKRRKFLKSTALALAATAIPAAVLAGKKTIHERSWYITGCDHVISLHDCRCLKCGITEEALVNQVSESRLIVNVPPRYGMSMYGDEQYQDMKSRLATKRLQRIMELPRTVNPRYKLKQI
jgi:hypothetical protein